MQGLWSLIGKIGTGAAQNFPYEIGVKIGNLEDKSVWTLHEGKKKGTGETVSVFVHDVKSSSEDKVQTAKLALRRLKTLRHPNILRYIDALESDTVIYLVTEPVRPLEVQLNEDENSKSDLAISWGLHQITAGLSFLTNDCSLIHGNVCMASVFVDVAGEWKLGGVEYLKPVDPPPNTDEPDLPRLPVLQVYEPPEGRKFSKGNKKVEKWSADMWGLGCLIWEVFNGSLSRTGSLKSVGKIPKNLVPDYVQLVGANPKSRPNPAKFLQECRAYGHYLKNSFVDSNLFLQELQIKEQKEQKQFFQSLSSSLDMFPQQYCKHKILPQLLNAYEYGSAGSAVLGPLFKVGKLLETDEYQQKIVPCVVKLFSSTDRATRIHLLQQLDNFVQHLKPSTVDEQIFPHVALGFGDTIPAMREQTVKSMLLLAPKLSEKTINNQLLKYFAKLQMDQEPGIRTNTTVCLGKIAVNLPSATRQKVLIPAFLRALRDPFPPARTAGVMGFLASAEYFSLKESAAKILPALCTLTVDPERKVRDQVFKVVKMLLAKIEKASEDPESAVNQTEAEQVPESAAGGSWTGWAVSSLTSKLYRGGSGSGGASEPADKSTPGKETNPVDTTAVSKTTSEVPPETKQTTQREKDRDSGSDYGGDLSGDEWNDSQEPDMGELKSDLLAAKEEIAAFQSAKKEPSPRRPANLLADIGGAESGSDYGDWENDDWSVDSFAPPSSTSKAAHNRPQNKKTVQQTRSSTKQQKSSRADEETLVSEMLGGASGQPSTAASGWDEDLIAPKVKTKSAATGSGNLKSSQQSKKTLSTDKPPQLKEAGDAWDVGDWGSFEESPLTSSAPAAESQSKKTPDDDWDQDEWGAEEWGQDKPSKAELAKKKREERKQRLQAQKDKRSAGGRGPMKLGAVKMQ
ncbi:N-terminal kinase-like protein [Desmophyllum pertusum]|uniref:N-terminal kinase-like protein n=1 Tax=Desmophyllum pertusum TaxID=174260 RepID=A0A9W9YN91_9CNID|nr:N-terminal kinase-like protein [Desmophyllum pertusum]